VRYLIEPIAGSQRALVFGVVWASVVGTNPEKQARQHARKAKAQFYTRARARSTVVGTLTLRSGQDRQSKKFSLGMFDVAKRRPRGGGRQSYKKLDLYSAAAAFARAYDRGAVAVHLPLRDGGFWVSAAIDGMVQIGADVIHDTAEAAAQHLAQLRQMHPSLQVLGHDGADGKLQEGVFLDNLTETVKLQRAAVTVSDLPLAFWLGVGVLASLLIWQGISQRDAARQQAWLEANRQMQAVDPVATWQDALHAWEQSQIMHGMSAVHAMLASIARMPVSPGRWELDVIDCQPALCQALYRRTRLADNPGLQTALPPEWAIQWIDMDRASVSVPTHWQSRQRGDIAAMPDAHAYVHDVLAHWQRVRPAMEDIRIGPKTAVNFPTPLAPDADGHPAPVPFPAQSGLVRPAAHEVTIHAPLRTMPTLAWPDQSQVLLLQVRRSRPMDVDLRRSAFHAMLKGVIYVQ